MRHDAGSGQVRVVSRAYDDPSATPANGPVPQPRAKRRWFGRS
ncbi:hypothetical protein [Kitasatospora sp. NPDC005856]